MGCASSKIDDLPAVILCRERLDFLSQAVHQRYAFAEAHVAYTHSLSSLGVSLRHFFDSSTSIPPPSASPVINLPPQRKLADDDKGHGHGHDDEDDTGSHLHFHTDSDDDEDDDDGDGLHHDDHDGDGHDHGGGGGGGGGGGEILNHHHGVPDSPPRGGMMYDGGGYDGGGGGGGGGMNGYGFNPYMYPSGGNGYGYINNNGGGNMHVNYMKKHVTPSVSYEQRPVSYETGRVQFGDPNAASSSSSSSNYYDYFGVSGGGGNGGPNYGNYYGNNGANNGYMNMNYGGGGGPGGLFGGPRGWGGGGPQVVQQQQQAKAAPPPPPPPPPATSAWDFMNLFESIDNHYQSYAASRDSREVREEEGIPDLEDEDGFSHQNEVVKEVHGNQKLVDDNGGHIIGSSSGSGSSSISSSEGRNESKRGEKGDREEVVVGVGEGESSLYRRPSTSNEGVPVEYEVHMVDKKVVGDPGKAESQAKRPVFRNVSEVVHEIQVQFERAASSGNELTKVLEVGKHRYHRKGGAYQVSAKMLNVITPSLPSSSKDEGSLAVDEDVQLRSVNLSATLQKLYLWEKKLFEEVKAEEKMRVLHDRKSNKLRRLADKGAEPQKIESTRNEVRSLSTKIRIAIQIVDRISVKINKLRDEELWPQLNELIQGLSRMWKAMLECHHSQCEAIDGARGLDAIAFPNNPTDSHLEASLQLEHDLLNWTCRFTEWIGAQKGYVRALNGWLLKCISPEPEETDDGPAPFSPGRAGAPPVFVICHQWDQSLERISETSEKDLIDSMRVFSMMVLHFRERDKGELRQRMTANRDMERKVKTLEKEDLKMQKKMVLASGDSDGGLSLSGHVVYQSDTSSKTSLQAGLRHVFEAMDRFTADSVKAYEELLQRSEEVIGEHRGDS